MAVTKSGRTTGTTESTIVAVGVTSNVNYGAGCDTYRFVNQIQIASPQNAFGGPGDSGSAIFERDTLTPVGLLFAGSDTSIIANPMALVFRALRIFPDSDDGAGPRSEAELTTRLDALAYPPAVRDLMAIQARSERSVFANPGVVSMGVGRREAGDGYAFVVSVEKKTPAVLKAIPHRIEGVPVRVLETGPIRALPMPRLPTH
jgi:hypothetical protein